MITIRIPSMVLRISGVVAFVLGFVLLCSIYEYGRVMNMRPFPHHLSRQTAALSFTYTYWEQGNALFDPQIQHLAADGLTSGRTVAECPILYYAVAQLWRITGPSEFVYRAFMLLLHFTASFFLFTTLRRILRHGGWASVVSLFFFTSPAIVYFAISFMPDVPAFDLMLLGLCALFAYWPQRTKWGLVLAALLFTLAGLLKLPALMAPLVLIALLVAEVLLPRVFGRGVPFFQHKILAGSVLLAVLLVNFAWYAWSKSYVDAHHFPFSHSGTWAMWDLTQEQFDRAVNGGADVMVWQLFDTPAWIIFGAMLMFLLVHARHVERSAWLALTCLVAGVTLFTLLWFITLDAHEYYFIVPLLLPLLITVLFLLVLRRVYEKAFNSRWTMVAFLVLLGYHAVYAANNQRMRTRGRVPLNAENYLPIYHPAEVHFWDMAQYWDMEPMLTITPYNRSIGIYKEDRVMCMSDATICASLYFMDQRGWTTYSFTSTDTASWNERIRAGAKYLFVKEGLWDGHPVESSYMTKQIGAYKGMLIYDLRKQ